MAGLLREIDVLVDDEVHGEPYRVLVECRHHQRPVDVGYIEQVVTKGRDLCCNMVHVVSTMGFTSGAVAKAKIHTVRLSTLRDVEAPSWPSWIRNMPVVEGRPYMVVHGSTVHVREGTPIPTGMPEGFSNGGSPCVVLFAPDGTATTTLGEALQNDFPPQLFLAINPMQETASDRKLTYYKIPEDRIRCLRFPSGLVSIDGIGLDLEFGWQRKTLVTTYADYWSVLSQRRKGGAATIELSDGSLLLVVERSDGRLFAQRLRGDGQVLDVPVTGIAGAETRTEAQTAPADA